MIVKTLVGKTVVRVVKESTLTLILVIGDYKQIFLNPLK
jgi:hypothetical protein